MVSRVRIVTDSTSDVPTAIAEQLHITVVPAYVQIGARSYREGPFPGGLSREAFYAQLPTMPDVPTTAVPPAHEFAAAYRDLIGQADEVVAIVVASNLSGMYNVAHLGAREVPELPVHVIDSGQVTMGLGWMAIIAAEAAAEGQSAADVVALIEGIRDRVYVYAMLDTLEYLRRSGRVSWARTKMAQVLRVKPIIQVYRGEVSNVGRARTRRRAVDRLIEHIRALGTLDRLALLHTYSPDLDEFQAQLSDLSPTAHPPTVAVTTIIGAHVGPQGLGVAAVAGR